MSTRELLDPTAERTPARRERTPRPPTLDGLTVGLLDIAKARGDVFLDRIDALMTARAAAYSERDIEAVPVLLRERYFDQQGATFHFRKKFRRSLIFGRNDLTADAPISKVDLLVCRNTLMYFDAKTQARILNRFHFALREGGFLVLGKAETLTAHGNKFEPIDFQRRVFKARCFEVGCRSMHRFDCFLRCVIRRSSGFERLLEFVDLGLIRR